MSNEAIIVELLGNKGDPIRYTIVDATAVPKGTIMELVSPRTVQKVSNHDVPVVGILAEEKVLSDGQTSVAVYTNGIFQFKCATVQCEIGDGVKSIAAGDGTVELADTTEIEKGWSIGYALETIGTGSTGMVRVLK